MAARRELGRLGLGPVPCAGLPDDMPAWCAPSLRRHEIAKEWIEELGSVDDLNAALMHDVLMSSFIKDPAASGAAATHCDVVQQKACRCRCLRRVQLQSCLAAVPFVCRCLAASLHAGPCKVCEGCRHPPFHPWEHLAAHLSWVLLRCRG